MLNLLDYALAICGILMIVMLFAVIYVNRSIVFSNPSEDYQDREIKRLNAENKRLDEIIAGKNRTITNLLNKNNEHEHPKQD